MKNSPDIDVLLAECGLKRTAFRRELLEAMAAAKAPLSAAQLYAALLKNKKLKGADFDHVVG